MNRKFFACSALVLLLLASCKNEMTDGMEFDTVTVERTVNLSNEDNSPKCSVSLNLAYATESNGHRAEVLNNYIVKRLFNMEDVSVKTAIEDFSNHYTASYKQNLLPLYNQDRADTTKRAWYDYHYVITTETRPGSKGTIAYLATVDYYEGGAHGINQLLPMNVDTETGQHLTLSDIFVPGYEQLLNQILLKALMEKAGVKNLAALRDKGYLRAMEMFPTENFILDDETITFTYNPSEIAPYETGTTVLIIPYEKIEKILRNSFDY